VTDSNIAGARSSRPGYAASMEIPKEKIIELLRERGADDKVQQAEQELPDQVDPEQHADLLEKLGINPEDLLGGIGDKLGL
jgi:hypothetical protein